MEIIKFATCFKEIERIMQLPKTAKIVRLWVNDWNVVFMDIAVEGELPEQMPEITMKDWSEVGPKITAQFQKSDKQSD